MKKKLSVLIMLIIALSILFALPISANAESLNGFVEEYGDWYYYRDGVMVTDEVIEYGGHLYAFDEWGRMYDNQEFWFYDEEAGEGYYYRAQPGGPLYENEWYWDEWNEDWCYYGENGVAPNYEFVTVNGVPYYFEYGGRMLTDGATSVWDPETGTDAWYAFDENGGFEPLDVSKPGWVECKGNWYYVEETEYGDISPAYNEILNINGTNYLFNDNHAMATDEFVSAWNDETWESDYYYANAYGMPHVGWIQPYANETDPDYSYRKNYWYYYGADGKALEGYNVVGGTGYYFYDGGRMATDTWAVVEADGDSAAWAWVADKNGIVSWTYHGWLKVYDSWRYFDSSADNTWDSYWLNGLQEIDGSYYYFRDGGNMLDDATYGDYRAKEGGRLYQSEWYKNESGNWYYYDYQCQLLRNTVVDLYGNGTYYAFGSMGYMLTDQIVSDGYGFDYILDKNGVGTRVEGTGWYAVGNNWAYAEDGDLIYGYGLYTIGDSEYYFDGYYILQDTCYDGYLFAPGGQKITTPGWHIVNGEYYYVTDASGALVEYGWYAVDGKYYYFWPEMAHNTIIEEYETGYVYGFDTNGNYFQVTGDGFYTSYPGVTMYVKDSKLVTNAWEWIDGCWYYFDEYGYKVQGPWYVDDTYYLFDTDGRLVYDSWYTYYGDYYTDGGIYRSDASGKVLTGYQYVDGKYYLFTEYGALFEGGIAYQDGWTYLLHNDGSVYGYEFTPYTWYLVDGEWYYFADGYFLEYETAVIGGYEYAFDSWGRMVTNRYFESWDEDMGYYRDCYYDAAGHKLVNAWHYTTNGYKYFDEDGDDYYWGYFTIDGVEYCFDGGYLKVGTFVYDNDLVTTTAGGAVISKTPLPEGWTYADGTFYYVEDGSYYTTGWVGPYYVESGEMVYGSIIYDDGERYYINGNGVYVTGWYNLGSAEYPEYIYANADGTLKYNEWAEIGGVWYYFEGTQMCADGTYYIDGERHEFAESGAWLGKVEEEDTGDNGYANGWVYLDGEYYYSYNGRFLTGNRYIDGKWYYFGGDGSMIADAFRYTYDGYGESLVYYTASGALFEGTGWHVINGEYVYFNADSSVQTGLIEVGGVKYYISGKYINEDTDDEQYIYYMVSNGYVLVNGELYYASAGGALSKVADPNGWYWAENWNAYVCYQNGTLLCDGEHVVNGVTYYFWSDGEMAADYLIEGAYYDASGAKATGSGWYWSEDYEGWVYVNEGKVYSSGVYYIGGVAYYFNYNGLWVQ